MLIGRRINDRYKVLSNIGGGGMANVYLARDMILDRDVAVKILRLEFAHEEEFITRFNREAQSATSLNHQNIVNIYDVGMEDDIYYIVMEYVDGMTLKQYIQQFAPLSVEKTLNIMEQLTSAISVAHHHHIIHRDIKPQNILMAHSGEVKVTDFGIAVALSATSITQTNAVLGSVHYISPEQARGGMATRKSDIYSLGIVMYELLTGRLPFFGESAISIALKHLQSEAPPMERWNPTLPQSVKNIVLKSTAKDPFHRYGSVEELREDIQTALDPTRLNEPKFQVPEDPDQTKAIPIITDSSAMTSANIDDTVVHQKGKSSSEEHMDKNVEKTNESTKKRKRRKWPWVLVSLLILLALFVAATYTVLPKLIQAKKTTVPNVKNVELNTAIAKIKATHLKVKKTVKSSSKSIDSGKVIKTSPANGTSVEEGKDIIIYVSTGEKKITVDDYTGKQYNDILSDLRDKGYYSIEKNEEYSNQAEGEIISQTPKAGTSVIPSDTTMSFTVSKGKQKVSVRDLKGYTRDDLDDYEDSSGLKVKVGSKEYSDSVEADTVISQTPTSNTELEVGDTVTVVISKGPKELPPKTVKKEIEIPYDNTISDDSSNTDSTTESKTDDSTDDTKDNASDEEEKQTKQPQHIEIYIEDMNHSMTEPLESFDITENTKKTLEFTVQEGQKAGYKVMRNSTVILEDTVTYPKD